MGVYHDCIEKTGYNTMDENGMTRACGDAAGNQRSMREGWCTPNFQARKNRWHHLLPSVMYAFFPDALVDAYVPGGHRAIASLFGDLSWRTFMFFLYFFLASLSLGSGESEPRRGGRPSRASHALSFCTGDVHHHSNASASAP